MKVYSLLKKKETNEMHLFEGTPILNSPCVTSQKSICQKMDKSENVESKFTCKDENEARLLCAKIGRGVCGDCLSHLYKTL